MTYTDIAIDLDVYKALETNRISFDETHNAILRRLLSLTTPSSANQRRSLNRSSGTYTLHLLGEDIEVRSIREGLSTALLQISARKPGFLEKLSNRPTTKGRRIVARRPDEVYPNRPQLIQYAAPLNAEWYFDTNISRKACERYLEIIGSVANIEAPRLSDRPVVYGELNVNEI